MRIVENNNRHGPFRPLSAMNSNRIAEIEVATIAVTVATEWYPHHTVRRIKPRDEILGEYLHDS